MSEAPDIAPDSVRRSLSWTLLGELSFAAAQWFSLMVVAKLGSAEALGRYSLGIYVATPVIVLINLHLRPIYVVDTRARWSFPHYFGLRLLLQPVALAITAAVCLIRGWPWQTAAVVCLIGLIRVTGSVSDILYARAQRAEKMNTIGVSRAIRGALWIGLLAVGLAIGDEVLALSLVALALVLSAVLYDLRKAAGYETTERMRPSFDPRQLGALAWKALPMGLAGFILGVGANMFAYILEGEHGLEAVGFFAAVLTIVQASGVINMAVGNAAIARLAKLSVSDARGFWRLLLKILGLTVALNGLGLVAIVVIGEPFLRYAFAPAYVVYYPQLVLASIAAVLLGVASMLSQTITALSQFRLQLVLNLIALAVSIALGIWRIPQGGIAGAVEAVLMLAGFRLVLYTIANLIVGPRASRQARP